MLARIPIRLRLTVVFALAMALVLAATGAFLYLRLASELDRTLNTGLRSRAQDIASFVQQTDSGLSEGIQTGLPERGESFAQVLTLDGRVVDTTPQLGRAPLLDSSQLGRAARGPITFDRGPVGSIDDASRVLALPVTAQDSRLIVVVGTSLTPRHEALEDLRTQLLIGGPLALLLASLAGYGLTAAAFRPVEAMRSRAANISGGRPGERLPVPEANDEIRRLGETLNQMLERIDATVRRERRFVADASHEVRTPLALLRSELELAGRPQRTREELADAVGSATEEVERLTQLTEDLLVLARSDEGDLPVRLETLSARALLEEAALRFRSRAEAAGRSIEIRAGDSEVTGDRLRLEQALGNLIENSLRYGDGPIELFLRVEDGGIELHVADEGSGFDADFLPRAFQRFARADEARSRGGTGLGLAIVDVIAQAHKGSAGAINRIPSGADAWIALPRDAAAQAKE